MNAGDHVASQREGLWMANFPPPSSTITYHRLPSPWEPRWACRPDGRIPTWTQSRVAQEDPDAILPSSYQTHLICLLYIEDSRQNYVVSSESNRPEARG
eukprot:1525508-Pyramimonas_sp.AAC.1